MSGMLPKGWMEVSIGEIAFVSLGKTPSKKDYLSNGSLKVIKSRDVNNGVIDFFNDKTGFVRVDEAVVSSMTELKMWDVLTTSAAHSGENIGKKTAIVTELPEKFERGFFTGELLNVRIPNHFLGFEIVSKMIYYFLSSEAGYKGIQKAVAGVHLTQGRAKGILFPLPPLNEQKRIVAKVDAIMPRIDSAKKRLEKIPAILKRFRQSVLTAAVTGKLTEKWREEHPEVEKHAPSLNDISCLDESLPNNWIKIKTRYCCSHITKGTTPKNNDFVEVGVPFLKVYNIVNNKIDFEYKAQFVSQELHATLLKRSIVHPGAVVMNIVGPPLGKVAIIPKDYPEWNLNQAIAIFRPVNVLFNRYLYFVFLEGRCLLEVLIDTRGVVGQSNLSLEQCQNLEIPLPPLDEQKEIVRQVDKLFALADKVEEHYQKARARVDALAQSVLAKAFRGELVPQNPDDEPAEKLLQRIQEEKTKMEAELKTASRSARETRKNGAKTQRARPEEKQASEP